MIFNAITGLNNAILATFNSHNEGYFNNAYVAKNERGRLLLFKDNTKAVQANFDNTKGAYFYTVLTDAVEYTPSKARTSCNSRYDLILPLRTVFIASAKTDEFAVEMLFAQAVQPFLVTLSSFQSNKYEVAHIEQPEATYNLDSVMLCSFDYSYTLERGYTDLSCITFNLCKNC